MSAGLDLGAARYGLQRFTLLAIFAALMFWSAGRLDWDRGWAFVGVVGCLEAATLVTLAVLAPTMLNQRGRAPSTMTWFDWLFVPIWLVLSFTTPIVAGQAVRAANPETNWMAFWVGTAIMTAASAFGAWAMLANTHFEQFVRIQTDRDHQVVTTGPYSLVRHPGYLAACVGALSAPLMLGVLCTALPALLITVLFVCRTALEDRTLQRSLPGYARYAEKTRQRLIPGMW
jgi:protein-S-isoprenylcysteine O-methyltransferase Ste14